MTVSVSNLKRVTCVVSDAKLACAYLEKLFRAQRLENVPSHVQAGGSVRVFHIGLGDLVIEFVEPLSSDSLWRRRLEGEGPHVVSLAYGVADLDTVIIDLSGEGLELVETASSAVWCRCRHVIGVDLVFEPCPGHDRETETRGAWGDVSPMLHVEITHDNIAAAGDWLARLFGSKIVEMDFSKFLVGITAGRMKIQHVNLGDAVLQYIEPRHDAGPWWGLLQASGPSVHNITWLVNDMAAVAEASQQAGTRDLRYFEFDYSPLFGAENKIGDTTIGRILDCAHILGFHLELSERQARNINDFMFKPV